MPVLKTDGRVSLTPDGDTLRLTSTEYITRLEAPGIVIVLAGKYFVRVIQEAGNVTLSELRTLTLDYGNHYPAEEESQDYRLNAVGHAFVVDYSQSSFSGQTKSTEPFQLRCICNVENVMTIGRKLYPIKLSSFLKAFPDKKRDIRDFVKANKVDFDNPGQVAGLFEFCSEP